MKDKKTENSILIESLFKKYSNVLYHRCYSLLNDKAEAEDALQDTFINAYKSLNSFKLENSYLSWLFKIATNVCFNYLRTKKRKGFDKVKEADNLAEPINNSNGNIHIRQILENLTSKLDEKNVYVFIAYYHDGMKQHEIAEHLGISRRAVVKRLKKIRQIVNVLFNKELINE